MGNVFLGKMLRELQPDFDVFENDQSGPVLVPDDLDLPLYVLEPVRVALGNEGVHLEKLLLLESRDSEAVHVVHVLEELGAHLGPESPGDADYIVFVAQEEVDMVFEETGGSDAFAVQQVLEFDEVVEPLGPFAVLLGFARVPVDDLDLPRGRNDVVHVVLHGKHCFEGVGDPSVQVLVQVPPGFERAEPSNDPRHAPSQGLLDVVFFDLGLVLLVQNQHGLEVHPNVLVDDFGFLREGAGPGNDGLVLGLVDEHTVDLVNDQELPAPVEKLLCIGLVVVELHAAKGVRGPVQNIGTDFLRLGVFRQVPDSQAQGLHKRLCTRGVPLGQSLAASDDVDFVAFYLGEVGRDQTNDEGLAFASNDLQETPHGLGLLDDQKDTHDLHVSNLDVRKDFLVLLNDPAQFLDRLVWSINHFGATTNPKK